MRSHANINKHEIDNSFSKHLRQKLSFSERQKWRFRVSRFQNFLGEHGPTPRLADRAFGAR